MKSPKDRRGLQKHGAPQRSRAQSREGERREHDHLFNEWDHIHTNI